MFLKTEDCSIIGITGSTKLYWKECEFDNNDQNPKSVSILCDGVTIKRFRCKSMSTNVEDAKAWLTKVFEALKRNEHFYEMESTDI